MTETHALHRALVRATLQENRSLDSIEADMVESNVLDELDMAEEEYLDSALAFLQEEFQ